MLQSAASRVPRRESRPFRHELSRRASTAVHRPQPKTGALPPRYISPGKRTLNGRFLSFVPTVTHTMAALRAIETKYGRVADFKFMRDFVVPSNYQLWFSVTFHKDLPELQQEEDVIHIASPEDVNIYREGGISLEELLPQVLPNGPLAGDVKFLDPELSETEQQGRKPISFVLYRKYEYACYLPYLPRHQSKPVDVSRSFLKWGGFHNLQKIEPRKIKDIELFSDETPATDHIRMYRVLQKHASVLGIRSPYEIRPEIASTSAPEKWESIPELEDSSAVAKDPSDAIQAAVSDSQQKPKKQRKTQATQQQPNSQKKTQLNTDAVYKQPSITPNMVASMLRDIKLTEDDIADKDQALPHSDLPKQTDTSAQLAAAVAQSGPERDLDTEEARLKRAAEADARLKAAELEAAGRMKAAKLAAGKTKLKGQLRSAERATVKVVGKKKDATQTAGMKTTDRGFQFKPSYKVAPSAAAKKTGEVKGEKKPEGIASKIASFFKFGG